MYSRVFREILHHLYLHQVHFLLYFLVDQWVQDLQVLLSVHEFQAIQVVQVIP